MIRANKHTTERPPTRAALRRDERDRERRKAFHRATEDRVDALVDRFQGEYFDREDLKAAILQLTQETNREFAAMIADSVEEGIKSDYAIEWVRERWEDLRTWWRQVTRG